jgi:diguanylate cyclase (GGDEF)-like protein/PAS domain S-box-containing protein
VILGVPADDLLRTQTLLRCADAEEQARVATAMRSLLAGEIDVYRDEIRVLRADGRPVWVDIASSLVCDPDGRPLYRLSQLIDVTARRENEESLRHQADHDPLTGLVNRRRLYAELDAELAAGRRSGSLAALCVLDLDGFKGINDTLGHAAGDEALERVARALGERVRSGDVVARLGGDEFAVLLRRVGVEEARRTADALVEVVGEALRRGIPADLRAGVSIGVAVVADGDPDELLHRADEAMYAAKQQRGNCALIAG